MTIEAKDLRKTFGKHEVVRGASFVIPEGQTVGLLGPNGAGKTTTINMMLGLLRPTSGSVTVFGRPAVGLPAELKSRIGYVPQDMAFFPELSGLANVTYWGRLYGLRGAALKAAVQESLEFTQLWDRRKDAAKSYSGGMQRRLNISCGIVHKPKVLFMDEPTVGVDPQSRNHILESARRLAELGSSIVYTSHYMEEIQTLCDSVIIIDEGTVVADGPLDAVIAENAPEPSVVLDFGDVATAGAGEQVLLADGLLTEGRYVTRGDTIQLHRPADVSFTAYAQRVLASGLDLTSVREDRPTLENVFLNLTGKKLRD
ncbi:MULTISPECIES: ABC transporter ATP-binding protein [Curtobacterium]|jgi:ABC-2 type transport system ATP-binding protein|uniref:ABC transporter ATP-binding protein n=1 Tax=Curtobacterium TaxID=2034 RepID=UPI000DAA09C3|nr:MULTISPECIES: ABC transporter ATP-binding protein [Curtobacterium]MDF2805176.1 export transporter ATP-binding protein [Cellulosimicrobium sp.]MBT1673743.1 ABC transporter ATP-binding protein [Curtobacterium flaccumfaciens pv. flaccumfaciens]MCS6552331.1 ABC transporter ATP-binding protein [Curtobacterium flaccumfaciens pv. flaccumfaciens]PZE29536.1 export ABC transporter ATP-binding protein [Curtobacterium sp. MCLR17_042]WIE78509.1 ABC transporter ATP-binding protein [Curtobacterium sp. MCS